MKIRVTILCFLFYLLALPNLRAQGLTVTGRVTTATGEPATGATVSIKGTNTASSADATGAYRISVPSSSSVLIFSLVGMQSIEQTVGTSGVVNVVMQTGSANLNEVVVIGYGLQRRANVTSAISSVKAEQLNTVSTGRIDQALQGRTAGVNVVPTSGSPGSGMRIRIRGTGSNLGADPLYIVDGVRTGGIDNIDPSEVASIEVLKDAASAAIYGSAAANGVVLITTKTGRRNTSDITYSTQYGQQSVGRLPKMMNAQQYQQYNAEAKTPGGPTLADLGALNGGQGTDWFDALFQNAPLSRHAITFSGGTEKSTFLMNGTYFTQQGIIGGDKSRFDRYTVRLNSDHKLKSWLNIGNRLSYANIHRRGLNENSEFGSVVGSALAMDPFTPVTYTGAISPRAQAALAANRTLVKDANGNYYGISNFIFGEYGNPLARIAVTNGNLVQHKVEGNVFADIEPFKGFKFTSRFGIDGAFQREHGWTPTFWFSNESLNTQAGGSDWQNNWFTWQWENFANYTKRFGDHHFNLLAGTSANKFMWNYVGGSYSGLFKEELLFSYADAVPDLQDRISSNANSNTLNSYFGRISYDFKNKYLFNASIRRDGASVFAEGHKWGTFPAVSLGWVVSNEDFYTSSSIPAWMNSLKFRGSWGRNGSTSNIGIGAWQALVGTVNPGYVDAGGNFLVGAAPTSLPNPELRWETSEQVDLGADISFLKNRLTLTVDKYKKTTKDLLTPGGPSVPAFVGNTLRFINSGEVENKGWEFDLAYRKVPAEDGGFSYDVSANFSTLKNEVTRINAFTNELPGAGVGTGWNATVFKVGLPVWSFRGYQTNGIFQTQDDINAYLTKTGITGYAPKPGEPVVVDVNGDKQISTADQTFIGSPHPDFIYGGRINVAYKGFDLLVFGQGQAGNDVLMGFNRTDRPTANRPSFFYTNRWTGPGSTNSWFASNTNNQYIYNSDLMIFDGSYFRIRQLQLGYTLAKRLSDRAKIRNARIYVSLDDFFTFTKYPGLDPEGGSGGNNSLGIDRGVYPLARKALVGLQFSF
ncbi:MAG: SusC/RagA family TonB-linked outer membrane protein [Segetibacter sp.]|nr:SusC/RagA family TonB-linked outer membrane protein [Segetibacter sp.]